MIILEKVMKKNIIEHLTKNSKFNKNQYSFVKGRSTQTQLLVHYDDIYEAMKERKKD